METLAGHINAEQMIEYMKEHNHPAQRTWCNSPPRWPSGRQRLPPSRADPLPRMLLIRVFTCSASLSHRCAVPESCGQRIRPATDQAYHANSFDNPGPAHRLSADMRISEGVHRKHHPPTNPHQTQTPSPTQTRFNDATRPKANRKKQ